LEFRSAERRKVINERHAALSWLILILAGIDDVI
jgi:hypothetical protein